MIGRGMLSGNKQIKQQDWFLNPHNAYVLVWSVRWGWKYTYIFNMYSFVSHGLLTWLMRFNPGTNSQFTCCLKWIEILVNMQQHYCWDSIDQPQASIRALNKWEASVRSHISVFVFRVRWRAAGREQIHKIHPKTQREEQRKAGNVIH